MLTIFFGPARVISWDDASTCDRDRFARFHGAALRRGILLPPSQFESWFLTHAHAPVLEQALTGLVASLDESA
jgi:glutamate-1-semialdehyde 2,1-aminomutase